MPNPMTLEEILAEYNRRIGEIEARQFATEQALKALITYSVSSGAMDRPKWNAFVDDLTSTISGAPAETAATKTFLAAASERLSRFRNEDPDPKPKLFVVKNDD